jgi:hypothetical protein
MDKNLCVSRSIDAVALLGLGIKSSRIDSVRRHNCFVQKSCKSLALELFFSPPQHIVNFTSKFS